MTKQALITGGTKGIGRAVADVLARAGYDLTLTYGADTVAAELAGALAAEKLLLLTNVEGIYRDINDPGSLVSSISAADARAWIQDGTIAGGMIPKVEACLTALAGGARKAHIIDGRLAHAIILELYTSAGIGTQLEP